MSNINIQVHANRKLSKKAVDIGNMQEHEVTKLIFELDEDIEALGGNVYLFVSYDGETHPYPLTDNVFVVGRELTQRKKSEANIVVSNSDDTENPLNGVVWISNTLSLLTDKNSINIDSINEKELPPSLQIVFENLLNLQKDLEAKRDEGYWKGDKGDKGEKGDRGAQGTQGPKGDTGEFPLDQVKRDFSPSIITSASGATVVTTDSAEATPVGMKLYGKSEQKTYLGNQLFNFALAYGNDDVKDIVINNDKVTFATGSANGEYVLDLDSIPEDTYTFGYHSQSNADGFDVEIAAYCVYEGVPSYYEISRIKNSITFDHTPDKGSLRLCIRPIGATTITCTGIVLCKGRTLLEWEPYVGGVASPSLAYQQDVVPHGASGSIEQKILTTNFLKIPDRTKVESGITMVTENGVVTVNGTCTHASQTNLSLGGSYGNTDEVVLTLYKGIYVIKDATVSHWNGTTRKFYYPNSTIVVDDVMNFHWIATPVYKSGQVLSTTLYPRIVLQEDTPFEPYSEQVLVHQTPNGLHGIPLGQTIPSEIANSPTFMSGVYHDGEQYWIGNTKNENGQDVQRVKKISPKKIIVFGSRNDAGRCSVYIPNYFENTKFLNGSIFAYSSIAPFSEWAGGANGTFCINGDNIYYKDSTKTLEEVNAEFAKLGTDVEFVGVLRDPIITDITEEELAQYNAIHMNYPNTTIVNSDSAYTKVEYVADTKKHIEQNYAPKSEIQEMKAQIAELQALVVNKS